MSSWRASAARDRRQDRLAQRRAVERVARADVGGHPQALVALEDVDVEHLRVGEDPEVDGLAEGPVEPLEERARRLDEVEPGDDRAARARRAGRRARTCGCRRA